MKLTTTTVGVLIGAMALVGVFAFQPISAQERVTWDYAYMMAGNGRGIDIFYVEPTGCRREQVWTPVGPNDPVNHGRNYQASTASAIRELGSGGWEMVTGGIAYCHMEDFSALHFKRPRR